MSNSNREDSPTRADVVMKDEAGTIEEIERGLADCAEKMSDLIEAGPVGEREALHDYAVSLVRDRMPVMVPAEASGRGDEERGTAGSSESTEPKDARSSTAGTAGVSLVGYGALLVPVGVILLLLFPPLGVTLLMVGVCMVGFGVTLGILGKFTPSRSRS